MDHNELLFTDRRFQPVPQFDSTNNESFESYSISVQGVSQCRAVGILLEMVKFYFKKKKKTF